MELIERETFRNELLSLTYYGDGDYYSGRKAERDSIIDRLNEQPAIDAAPVGHGRWVECDDDVNTWVECSECGFEQDIDDCGEHPHEAGDYKLCPACGARMDGGEGHEAG